MIDDNFYAKLGSPLIDILYDCDMLSKEITKSRIDNSQWILKVTENEHSLELKERIITLPSKLPIIVKPKIYS
jgi:hypothetical protein